MKKQELHGTSSIPAETQYRFLTVAYKTARAENSFANEINRSTLLGIWSPLFSVAAAAARPYEN